MANEKELQILSHRFIELARIAEHRYTNVFTDFLNLNEISLFYQQIKNLPNVPFSLFGGIKDCERRMVCFHGEDSFTNQQYSLGNNEVTFEDTFLQTIYPIVCIHIVPLSKKFSDTLTHRDYLGAILNLGIDRCKVGDIFVEDNEGYVFCDEMISGFIVDTLTKIKHTSISCTRIKLDQVNFNPSFIIITGTVTSVRLDSVISVAFKTSRSSITGYITGGKVYVNGREEESNSYMLKENDIISVRGLGKFQYVGTTYQTKKGRYTITVKRYN